MLTASSDFAPVENEKAFVAKRTFSTGGKDNRVICSYQNKDRDINNIWFQILFHSTFMKLLYFWRAKTDKPVFSNLL